MDVAHLESRYYESCRRQEILPNPSILSSFAKAKIQKLREELCVLEISLDQLTHSDFSPLIDVLSGANSSGIDLVDVHQESPGVLFKGGYVLSLLRAVNQKLRIVDLRDWSFWKDIVRDISRRGLACQILNLRFSPIWKLNMSGNFLQLHTLNLDFSISLASFRVSCFSCMPNLMRLSMCETRIANLWTTSAALSKLPSLVELRFQNCLCCYDTGACPTLSGGETDPFSYEKIPSGHHMYPYTGYPSMASENLFYSNAQSSVSDETPSLFISDDESLTNHESILSTTEESFDSELEFSNYQQGLGNSVGRMTEVTGEFDGVPNSEISVNQAPDDTAIRSVSSVNAPFHLFEEVHSSENGNAEDRHSTLGIDTLEDSNSNFLNALSAVNESHDQFNLINHVSTSSVLDRNKGYSRFVPCTGNISGSPDLASRKHISHHPSPICFEKHYREYMLASLPCLKVLDNLPIRNTEREKARIVFKQHFESLPYNRPCKESVVSILKNREMGMNRKSCHLNRSYSSGDIKHLFSRSLSAAKLNSCPWPCLSPLSKFQSNSREEMKSFRPRQFEYHPSDPSLMVFGTLDGEVVVINHESGKVVGYVPSAGALNSILGLCWLKKYPSKLIAGSDNGSLKLYDVVQLPSVVTDRYCGTDAATFSFDEFEHLTSVHINSTDEIFVASGFSKHVALYDIGSGRRLQVFEDLHMEHINVVKFAHHSPSIFATASFDQEVKMWDLRQGSSRPCYTTSSSRGNVMVCFSPDDRYLLSSAVDNEVKQHLAVDGRLHMVFDIASTGSGHNYTRSYYMNGRDYIISGSSEENVVRVCCAQTGRRLRDISLEGRGSRNSMFVQSLRGDPFRVFHMSVLAAYLRPTSRSEIIRVNLLTSGDCVEDDNCIQRWCPSHRMGG